MNTKTLRIPKTLLIGIYGYLIFPVVIFLAGWCKWFIAFPMIFIVCLSCFLCVREHFPKSEKASEIYQNLNIKANVIKCSVILLVVLWWVVTSGIGGYVWQNDDHAWRNAIFDLLVENTWPVKDMVAVNGHLQEAGLVYYIGFWLPAALIGKLFGINAGYAAQYVWAVAGILLFYALICVWRRKIIIWPLWIIIFFSGADAVGTLINSEDGLQLLGSAHLERWARHYQFSSMTTQLFWVFNQAIPAWLASAMIFLSEKPKNMIFTWSLIMITSTLPFAGLVPFILYFMVSRSNWRQNEHVPQLLGNAWRNWGSIQNVLGGGSVGFISFFYLMGNISVGNSPLLARFFPSLRSGISAGQIVVLALFFLFFVAMLWGIAALFLHKKGNYLQNILKCLLAAGIVCVGVYVLLNSYSSNTNIYKILFLFTFYLIEAGIYLLCFKDTVTDQVLFRITAIWLLVIPLIRIGSSQDFCMRASIPALILIMFWLIDALGAQKRTLTTWVLLGLFLIGSVTPLHEIKRTYVNTRDGYVLQNVGKDELLLPGNFSGETTGVFWEGIAR